MSIQQETFSLNSLTEYAKTCLQGIPHASKMPQKYRFRNRFTHSLRVAKWCERLMMEVPAQKEILLSAAILHDIGYVESPESHAQYGAEMARKFLSDRYFNESFIENVADLIAHHSEKNLNPLKMSNELKILQDADNLDELGGLTILWDSMHEGSQDTQSYLNAYQNIKKSYQNICSKNKKMKNPCADAIYQQRLNVIKNFLTELEYELFI